MASNWRDLDKARPLSERLDAMAQGIGLGADGCGWSPCPETIREAAELARRVEAAPVAIMDTRDALGICAPTEDDFPALYAMQGKRVALVEVDDG